MSVLGPGFGESIVVHVGGGDWVVIDSCIDLQVDGTRQSAPLAYLRALGVNVRTKVKLIVATHWHDDHIAGLADLLDQSQSAQFSCANVLTQEQFTVFAERMLTGAGATDGAGVREFGRILEISAKRQRAIRYASEGRELRVWPGDTMPHGEKCRILSFSPSNREYELFLAQIATQTPAFMDAKRSASSSGQNLVSVVTQIEWESTAILLGADMELHHHTDRGWNAAMADAIERDVVRSEIFKVSHHGSVNGHHSEGWDKLLVKSPIALLTPFARGSFAGRPPKDSDIQRVLSLAGESYITARRQLSPARTGLGVAAALGLRDAGIRMRPRRAPMGLIRLRRAVGSRWNTELFGAACRLEDHGTPAITTP